MPPAAGGAGSQTLDRGIRVLEVLAANPEPLSIQEVCGRLELHRSIVYRLLRTLEEHALVVREDDGRVRLGLGLSALARSVQGDLQEVALPELTRLANAAGMTAFLTVLMDDEAVTLVSVEPRRGGGMVAQRPGSRHRLDVGAPGAAIRCQLAAEELAELGLRRPPLSEGNHAPYVSHDEVIPGLQSVAVPLPVPGHPPAALAVVHVTGDAVRDAGVVELLREAARGITSALA